MSNHSWRRYSGVFQKLNMEKTKEYFNHILHWDNQVLWLALAFHAGFLNAGGFLACHRFVSHMTGFGTQIGVSVSFKEYLIAGEMIFAPISFIAGSGLAGYLIDRKIDKNSQPRLIQGILIMIFLNLSVFLGGVTGFFGVFGEPLLLQRDFLLLFILTFICGLQNGLFVSMTTGQIRTTHITGLSTDIGLNFVRQLYMKAGAAKKVHNQKNFLRIKTVLSFSIGSLIAAIIFKDVEYWGFLVSSAISLAILFWVLKMRNKVGAVG